MGFVLNVSLTVILSYNRWNGIVTRLIISWSSVSKEPGNSVNLRYKVYSFFLRKFFSHNLKYIHFRQWKSNSQSNNPTINKRRDPFLYTPELIIFLKFSFFCKNQYRKIRRVCHDEIMYIIKLYSLPYIYNVIIFHLPEHRSLLGSLFPVII